MQVADAEEGTTHHSGSSSVYGYGASALVGAAAAVAYMKTCGATKAATDDFTRY